MTTRPNILWLTLEDTSPRLGCYGDPIARTPNLDRLAAEGRRYTNAFSTAPVCAPSRSAVITGCYQTAIGTHHMRTAHGYDHIRGLLPSYSAVVPPGVKCFSETLRAAGYYCTNNFKTDYNFTTPLSAWDECTKETHWRNRPDPEQPFFAVFNNTRTHESGMWPQEGEEVQTDPDTLTLPPFLPDTPLVRLALARHYDNLARADAWVGRFLKDLEEDGLAENTVVFVWSDHGEGLPRAKRWPYDSGIRVPLIVRWPCKIEGGEVSADLVSMVDLAPTVLGAAGLPVSPNLHGQDFLSPQTSSREYVYATRDRYDISYDRVRAVRDQRYKYVRHYYPDQPRLLWIPYRDHHPAMQELWRLHIAGELEAPADFLFTPRPSEELFDTLGDPHELNNLADAPAHQATLERMRGALLDWQQTYGDLGAEDEVHMVERMWPGGVQPTTAAPLLIPLPPRNPFDGSEPLEDGTSITLPAPAAVQLYCGTQSASLEYTTEPGEAARWHLYTRPILLPIGTTTVRARAGRIGYLESAEVEATFTITPDTPEE
jgi:N-sulfoglucosamine sulfohydrolase